MKKLLNIALAVSMLLIATYSCTDVLDQDPVDTYSEDQVFSDVTVTRSYLGKCYDRMGGNTDNGILGGREDLLSCATDQTLCIHRPSNFVNLKGTMSPDQRGYFANVGHGGFLHWESIYNNIQNVNTVLSKILTVPLKNPSEAATRTNIRGEAYFIRAYEYAILLMNYGGAVITTTPYILTTDFSTQTRATLLETRNRILQDIDSAIAVLPASMEQGRANRAAAAALRARVLLFCASDLVNGGYEPANPLVSFQSPNRTASWQAARDAAKLIMDNTFGTFSLAGTTTDPPSPMTEATIKTYADNFFAIFNQKGKWNSETIWGIQFPLQDGNNYRPNIWYGPCGYHNWGNNDPTEPAVRKFEMADGSPFQWDFYNPGNQLLRTATAAEITADPFRDPYYGREPRFYSTVLYHGAPWQQRPSDAAAFDPFNKVQTGHFYKNDGTVRAYGVDSRQGLIEAWNGTKNGYYLKKFMDPATVGQYFRNTNTYVEFRLAEILLIYAEACIELGGADLLNGINALNLVRNRAGLPDRVTADQATARNYLRQERYIEFFAEGHQWYDIRRWMTATSGIITNVYEMKIKQFDNGNMEWKYDQAASADSRSWTVANSKFYWLPLSRDEMNKAPQLQQNPGYN